ncbi:hypothetical protein [Lutibacter citreus]|uniref:hypothetical protein n=1 Tax=Lutibacter citreus TaxID=2138210 RepID=UPI000DBE3048|nr:hypothetical protein [Lutibacter citreus]
MKDHTNIKKNSLALIDQLLLNLNQDITFILDQNTKRQYTNYINELKHIRNSVKADPRFPYQIIQNQIDYQLRTDKFLKVFHVDLHLDGLINNDFFTPIVHGSK